MAASVEARVARLEGDVAVLRAHADESISTSRVILDVLTRLDSKVDTLGSRMDKLDARMDNLDARMDKLDTRMDGLDMRMNKLDTRMDGLESRMTTTERVIGNMERSLKRVEGDVAELKAGHIELRNLVAGAVK